MRLFRKRKYAIIKDPQGRSARQRAFDLFWEGNRPAQVCKIIPISLRTACRYFEDFKKLNHNVPYSKIRKWLRENPDLNEKVINLLAASLGMSCEEVVARMHKPWGLMQAMKGKWPNYKLARQGTEIEERLFAAIEVIQFADKFGNKDPRMVREILQQMMLGR